MTQMLTHIKKSLFPSWLSVTSHIIITENWFLGCRSSPEKFVSPVQLLDTGQDSVFAASANSSTAIVQELVGYLEDAVAQKNTELVNKFNDRSKEIGRLSPAEEYLIYKRALFLAPNNMWVIAHYGGALQGLGHQKEAMLFYKEAVALGIWGHPLQRPVSTYKPGLTAKAFHKKKDYPFLFHVEKNWKIIRQEMDEHMRDRPQDWTQESENLHEGGDWTELRLISVATNGPTKFSKHYPKTMEVLNIAKEITLTAVKFSSILPGTHIKPHTGPSNERLRVHLGLRYSGGGKIRIGSKWKEWKEGKVLVFDDSFEHEVIHNGPEPRTVLIIDFWHPELPENERVFRETSA